MKLLFVLPEYERESVGGIRTFYVNLLPALAKAGCRVKVLVACRGTFDAPSFIGESGVEVEYLRSELFEKHSRNVAASYVRDHRTLGHFLPLGLAAYEQVHAGEGFDLVELTDWPLYFLPWVARGSKAPFTVSLHSSIGQIRTFEPLSGAEGETHFIRLLEAAALTAAPSVHTNSNLNAKYWEGVIHRKVEVLLPLVSKSNVTTKHTNSHESIEPRITRMGTDGTPGAAQGACPGSVPSNPSASELARDSEDTSLIRAADDPVLPATRDSLHATPRLRGAVFGRLQNWKGAEVLCEALRLAPEIAVDWYGRSVTGADGKGMYADELNAAFPDVYGNQFLHRGEITHEKVLEVMRGTAFVCVPSLWDVFNLTVVEAMSQGRVVVCSKQAGAEMLIEDGRNGFVFDPADPESLAGAMRRALQLTVGERSKMSCAAVETIRVRFDTDANIRQRIEYYGRVSKEHAAPAENVFLRDALDFPDSGPVKKRSLRQKVVSRVLSVLEKYE